MLHHVNENINYDSSWQTNFEGKLTWFGWIPLKYLISRKQAYRNRIQAEKALKILPKRMGGATFWEEMPCRRANARDRNVYFTKETH